MNPLRYFRLLLCAALVLPVFSGCEDETKKTGGNVVITGKFTNTKGDTLYLVDVSSSQFEVIDSAVVDAEGAFELRPLLTYKGFYRLDVGRSSQQFGVLILEAGDSVSVSGDVQNLGYTWQAKGSKDTERFAELNSYIAGVETKRRPLLERRDSIQRIFQVEVSMANNDSVKIAALDKKYGPLFDSLFNTTQLQLNAVEEAGVQWARDFIDSDTASFANIPVLRLLEPFDNLPWYDRTLRGLEVKHKGSPNVKILRDFVERERPYCKGSMAPDITLKDPDGKELKLSALRGKVVLIDFWASWCVPCMEELPNVVENYHRYKDKGFDVFSVSLDRRTDEWTRAIKSKKLVWPWHVLDNQDPQNPNASFATKYRVSTIPRTFLIDREGRFLDHSLSGEVLDEVLAETFAAEAGAETTGKQN